MRRLAGLVFLLAAASCGWAQDAGSPAATTPGGTSTPQPAVASPIAPAATPQASQQQPIDPATKITPPPQQGIASPDAGAIANTLPALNKSIWSQGGKKVTEIRFDGVTFSENDAIRGQLTQKAGEALDPAKVRADLRLLFASGRYRDINVSGVVSGDSIMLIYAGTPRNYVGRVEIVGVQQERLASLMEFATKLEPGTSFTEAQIPAAVESVKESLAENGYFEPVVHVVTKKDDVGHQVNATFTINTGVQARVGAVIVDGKDTGITVLDFRKKAGLNCGRLAKVFTKNCSPKVGRETTSNALQGVRKYYQKNDRLEGTISLQKQTYAPPRKQLDFEFQANQGPLVKVVVNGVKLSKSRVKLLVPIYEEGTVDIDLLNEGAFNIRDYLQQQGYFNVTDSVKLTDAANGAVTVEYNVTTGDKHRVTSIKIVGNKYFDTDTIEERLRVKKGDAYQRAGKYSSQLVAADTDSILALYRANGFNGAKVTSSVQDIDKDAKGTQLKVAQIGVTFTIMEGPQQKFGDVNYTGVDASRDETVHDLLSSQTGQPFSLITLSSDRDAVLGYYVSHGFDHAKVEFQQMQRKDDPTKTDVTLVITEGQEVFIDKVLLSGIVHTKPGVVQKQLLVHAGDPLDQSALLQTQRNLYNLALFNEVNAAVQNPTGEAPAKNVLVQLTEARRWDVTYGFGFEAQTGTPSFGPGTTGNRGTAAQNGNAGVSPRVSLDVSRINLGGTTKSLTLHTTYGLLETVATLSLNNPTLFGHQNLTGALSGGYSNVQNITTFQASTLQGDFRVTQKYKKADTFIYDFQYRRVSVNQSSLEITPNLVAQFSQPVTVGGPGITYFHDTRDPSPLDAGRGTFFQIQEFVSDSAFGAQSNFNRTDVSESSYYTFGKKKYVFARNTRVGFENAFGTSGSQETLGIVNCRGTLQTTNASCNPVPLPERLYAGGATSHRGFGINTAGPRDLTTGYPVGGSAAVVNTFELRLPPPTLPVVGDSISFVVFHDMGNVFRYPGDMFKSIRNFKQPDEETCRNLNVPKNPDSNPASNPTYYGQFTGTCSFNYYSHAIGLGARYKTPVGPIRVDFSYNLNPPIYPVFTDYSNVAPYVGQGSHFNFFFSIGQAF